MTLRYPDAIPLCQKIFEYYGINYFEIIFSIFLLIGLIILLVLFKSCSSRIMIIIVLLFCMSILPNLIIKGYQTYFAEGVYAIEYVSGVSEFSYSMNENLIEKGIIELVFINHSNEKINLYVSLRKVNNNTLYAILDSQKVFDNYKLTIYPKEEKKYTISIINEGQLKEHQTGGATIKGLRIIISDGQHERYL